MTLATTSNTTVAQGNGLTTSFTFTFPVPNASELFVYLTNAGSLPVLLSNSQYSTTGIGTENGGSVNYPLVGSPIPTGSTLTIQRIVTYQQLTSLVDQSGYYPNVVENALDYLTMQTQQLAEIDQLTLQVPLEATLANLVLPPKSARATTLVGFDALGNAITYPVSASIGAGNLTSEGPFVSGVGFTPGVTTSLALSQAYGTPANVSVHFDGTYQGTDQYSISGNTITFTSPIPAGVQKVYIVGGTTLSINVPPNQSVGDAQLSWGNVLNRVCDSIAALAALNISVYTRAFVTGYYLPHDGGGGNYQYSSSTSQALANGGSIIAAAGGTGCWILQHNGTVDVMQFGAKGVGVTFDDTPAFAAAVATGLRVHIPKPPAYFYPKTGNIQCSTAGQQITGDGKDVSIIQVDTGFNMSATGLFVVSIAGGGEGVEFSDFQVNYVQPDTTVRGNLTSYPVTIYAQGTQRMTMERVKIQNASYIVDLRNNPGGNNFVGCEFSWYNVAINIDGAVDSIKIDRCHFWPFAMTANQTTIFYQPSTIAINTGRCDDLHIDNCLFINGVQIFAYQSGLGSTFGNVTNTDFDTNIGIEMSAGSLNLAACYFSTGLTATNQAIIMTGGAIAATACRFAVGLTLSNAQVSIQGGGANFQLGDSFFELGTADFSAVACAAATTVSLGNCYFDRSANISPGSPTINALGGQISVTGCRTSAKGTGTGNFLAIASDAYHVAEGNAFNGWGANLPGSHSNLIFENNSGVGAGVSQHGFISAGTNPSGQITVTHGYGVTPNEVFINVSNATAAFFAQPTSFGPTSFVVNFWDHAGTVLANTAISFSWKMEF